MRMMGKEKKRLLLWIYRTARRDRTEQPYCTTTDVYVPYRDPNMESERWLEVEFVGEAAAGRDHPTVLRWGDITVLVDCPLDAFPAKNEPENPDRRLRRRHEAPPSAAPLTLEDVDLAAVDAVLVCSVRAMLGLPLLTEYGDFTGLVLATEPVVRLGRLAMLQADAPYTAHDAEQAAGRVQVLHYGQRTELGRFAAQQLRVTPLSSGLEAGGACWLLEDGAARVAYVGGASAARLRHPRVLDVEALRAASPLDAVVLAAGALAPPRDLDQGEALQRLRAATEQTLQRGGSVLLPCEPGAAYELLAHVAASARAARVVYFVAPAASQVLAEAGVLGEWLGDAHRARVHDGRHPFAALAGLPVVCAASAADPDFCRRFRPGEPCVALAASPEAVRHFAGLWRSDRRCSVLLSDERSFEEGGGAGGDFRVMRCVLDARLTAAEAEAMLGVLGARAVVRRPGGRVPIGGAFRPALVDAELARAVRLRPVAGLDAAVAPVRATLRQWDGELEVGVGTDGGGGKEAGGGRQLFGVLDAGAVLRSLQRRGLWDATESADGSAVEVPSLGGRVTIGREGRETTVEASTASGRRALAQAVRENLTAL